MTESEDCQKQMLLRVINSRVKKGNNQNSAPFTSGEDAGKKRKSMPYKKYALKWGAVVCFLVLLFLFLTVSQALLTPHIRSDSPESFLLTEYLENCGGYDVIFLGDCEVYESFSPAILWQNYGIHSWVCGTPQQLLWHSYTILKEVLRRETPRVVVLGVYGLCYSEPCSEAYNRMALEALPCSVSKWRGVQMAMTEGESALSYFFPLLRYHDRWQSLSRRDIFSLFEKQEPVSSHGFMVRPEILPGESFPGHEDAPPLTQTSFGEAPVTYLREIAELCREKEVTLILIKAPTDSWRYPWYEEYEAWTEQLSDAINLPYYNFLETYEEIGLDPAQDSCDGGFHLNVWGAEKLTAYFGSLLSEEYQVPDRRGERDLEQAWQTDLLRYDAWKQNEGEVTP